MINKRRKKLIIFDMCDEYGIDYSKYISYRTIDLSQTPMALNTGVVLIPFKEIYGTHTYLDGECDYCVLYANDDIPKVRRKTKLIFRNKGNAYFIGFGTPDISSLSFDNSGLACIETIRGKRALERASSVVDIIPKSIDSIDKNMVGHALMFVNCKIATHNRGDFVIGNNVIFYKKTYSLIKNKGNAYTFMRGNPLRNACVRNSGDFYCYSKSIDKCDIRPRDCVYITGGGYDREHREMLWIKNTRIAPYLLGGKKTMVINNVGLYSGNVFSCQCSVILNNVIFVGGGNVFKNGGYVDMIFEKPSGFVLPASTRCIKFENRGHVKLLLSEEYSGNEKIIADGRYTFMNSSNVIIPDIEKFRSGVMRFNNGGNVRLDNLVDVPDSVDKGYLRFENGKDVIVPKLNPPVNNAVIVVKNGRNLRIPNTWSVGPSKYLSPNGKIITDTNIYYGNGSYINRYNIPVKNGYVELVKGVAKMSKKALYDRVQHRWDVGRTVELETWDPYKNEVGSGKFVASFSGKPFRSMLKCPTISLILVRIAIEDLYEWPLFAAKHPEMIGFRKGTVIKILDDEYKG